MALLPISQKLFVRVWSYESLANAAFRCQPNTKMEPIVEIFERCTNYRFEYEIPSAVRQLYLTIKLDALSVQIYKSVLRLSINEINRIWGLRPIIDGLVYHYNNILTLRVPSNFPHRIYSSTAGLQTLLM